MFLLPYRKAGDSPTEPPKIVNSPVCPILHYSKVDCKLGTGDLGFHPITVNINIFLISCRKAGNAPTEPPKIVNSPVCPILHYSKVDCKLGTGDLGFQPITVNINIFLTSCRKLVTHLQNHLRLSISQFVLCYTTVKWTTSSGQEISDFNITVNINMFIISCRKLVTHLQNHLRLSISQFVLCYTTVKWTASSGQEILDFNL